MPEVASALLPSCETATEQSSSNSNRNRGSLAQRTLQRTLDITEVASSFDVVDGGRRATRTPRESMSRNELARRLQYLVARCQMNIPSEVHSTHRQADGAGGRAEELDEDPLECRGVSSTSMLSSSECAVLFFRRSGWVSWHAYGGLVLHPSRRVARNGGFFVVQDVSLLSPTEHRRALGSVRTISRLQVDRDVKFGTFACCDA